MVTRNVVLTESQDQLVQNLVASGRYQNASEALRASLRLLEREEVGTGVSQTRPTGGRSPGSGRRSGRRQRYGCDPSCLCKGTNQSVTKPFRLTRRAEASLVEIARWTIDNFRRREGKRGRIARSIGHNLHDRLLKYGDSVLRFMSDPDVSFTNNTGEQKIRMSKVVIKVSGCFRTERYAHARYRISSYLDTMAELEAILIALDGNAADMTSNMIGPRNGVSSYPNCFTSEPLATFI